ncbi:type II toxin-antitoxin system RelE/ParE family toxin [Marivibrio halodurans]|uniref:type II toxin-antitoxin system RelE/ParE family toxin n=1 Tax=Marivibrio halodurans TaxID=2039722 RepID=UPI0031BB17D7
MAEDSPDTASRFVHDLQQRFAPLCHSPEIGPRRDSLAPGLRAHFFRSYAIYYRITDTALIIMRVLHGARDAAALFGESEA